jgi:transposase-like protein
VEADESYFGGVRKGKRGRGAAGKIAVFGLLKMGGKLYTAIIPYAKQKRFCRSSKRMFNLTVLFAQTALRLTMH